MFWLRAGEWALKLAAILEFRAAILTLDLIFPRLANSYYYYNKHQTSEISSIVCCTASLIIRLLGCWLGWSPGDCGESRRSVTMHALLSSNSHVLEAAVAKSSSVYRPNVKYAGSSCDPYSWYPRLAKQGHSPAFHLKPAQPDSKQLRPSTLDTHEATEDVSSSRWVACERRKRGSCRSGEGD